MAYSRRAINEMHDRAVACLDAEFTDIPADSHGKQMETGFRAAVEEIGQKAVEQAGARTTAKVGTGQRSTARLNIRSWRDRLSETASIIARKEPGFDADFPLSYSETDEELLTRSRAVAAKASANEEKFTMRGLQKNFVNSGDALVAAFEAALETTNEALSRKGAATGAKTSAYQRADEFFDELDIYIRNKYADQPDKIHAWNIATHIERASPEKNGEGNGGDGAGGGNN